MGADWHRHPAAAQLRGAGQYSRVPLGEASQRGFSAALHCSRAQRCPWHTRGCWRWPQPAGSRLGATGWSLCWWPPCAKHRVPRWLSACREPPLPSRAQQGPVPPPAPCQPTAPLWRGDRSPAPIRALARRWLPPLGEGPWGCSSLSVGIIQGVPAAGDLSEPLHLLSRGSPLPSPPFSHP